MKELNDDSFVFDELSKTLNHAYKNSPFYKKKWEKINIDFNKLKYKKYFDEIPFTTKEDFRDSYPFGMLAVDKKELVMIHESSGTTGNPTPSFFTENDLNEWYEFMLKNGIKLNFEDIVLIKTPYSMLSTAHQMHGAARLVGATIIPASNRTQLMPYQRVMRLISDYKPTVLYCLPIELFLFSRQALKFNKNSKQDFSFIRGCVVNGEMLSEGKKRYLEDLWNTRIYQDYGSTETTTLAGECQYGNLHAWEDRYYFQVYDEINNVCSDTGTGELILTSLKREAMPMIKYRMGDIVTLKETKCQCGSTYKEVKVWGRISDKINVQGKSFFLIELEDVIYKNLIGFMATFWNVSCNDEDIDIFLDGINEEREDLELIKDKLKINIKTALGIDVKIYILPEGSLLKINNDAESKHIKPQYMCNKEQIGHSLDYYNSK